MKKLKTILKNVEKDMMSVLEKAIAKELGVDTVTIEGVSGSKKWDLQFKKITIDGHQITNVDIDRYSNLSCSIGKKFPVEYLPMFGRIVSELYPLECYPGRPNSCLHIEYWQRFRKQISAEDLKSMYRTGKGADCDDGFAKWHKDYAR